jgi:hypothetical protein
MSPAADGDDAPLVHGAVYVDDMDVSAVFAALHPTLSHGYAAVATAVGRSSPRAIPSSYKAALSGPNAAKWIAANDVELANHARNGTWEECYVPVSTRLIGAMWVYDIKHDGRYKARLVALGNQLQPSSTHPESASPTAGQLEFRTVIAISTEMEWQMHSYDVTAAYLYGKVPAGVRVFMRPPPGYVVQLPPKDGFKVALKLVKGLYGLPFAGRLWHDEFAVHLTKHGYKRDASAPCVFYLIEHVGHRQYIVLFVDDFTLTLECPADRAVVEREVLSQYKITGGELVTSFFGH